MEYHSKGVRMLSAEQHASLLENGYYIDKDGNKVVQDPCYFYASSDGVDIQELSNQVAQNTTNIGNINTALESILGV